MYKKTLLKIGVAFISASIFSSVHAQSNDSRILLDIQAMRQEIEQLRDLVERQQYELSKLQRSQQSGSVSDNRAPAPQPSTNTYGGPSGSSSTYGNPNVDNTNGTQAPRQNNGVGQNGYQDNPNVVGSVPIESYPGRNPDYQANPATTSPRATDNGVPIEERVVGADNPNYRPSYNSHSDADFADFDPDFDPTAANNRGATNPRYQDGGFQDQVPNSPTSGSVATPNGGLVAVPNTPPANGSPIQASLSEQDFYQQGFELLKKAEHEEAVQVFQKQISSYPQGDLVDDAYYWIAESKYVNRDLDGSKQNFKTIIARYKQSPRLPDAMLKTAYIEQEQGNVIEARILLQEIVQFHPRSNAAISAKNRLGELN